MRPSLYGAHHEIVPVSSVLTLSCRKSMSSDRSARAATSSPATANCRTRRKVIFSPSSMPGPMACRWRRITTRALAPRRCSSMASARKLFANASPFTISWHLSAYRTRHFGSSVFRFRITTIFAIAFGCELAYPRFPLESPMQPNQYDAATSTAVCVWCYSQYLKSTSRAREGQTFCSKKCENRGASLAARQSETHNRINPRARPSGCASSRRVFLGFFISSESLLDFSSKICDHEHGEGCAFCILQRTAHSSRPEIARSRVNSCGW